MAGTYRKKGNKYYLEYTYNHTRYTNSFRCDEVKSEKEVKQRLEDFCSSVRKNQYTNTSYTFYDFSLIWLKEVIKPNCSPITVNSYIRHLNNRIYPKFGSYKLNEITPLIITNFINDLKASKTMYDKRENQPLTAGAIKKFYNIVRAILQKAFEYDLIAVNPCKKVHLDLKNVEKEVNKKEEIHYYDKETYLKVLELLKYENFNKRLLIETALKTGMRRSEMWGLTWNDIDFEKKELSINKSRQKINNEMVVCPCKNKSSYRTISIPDSLLALLKQYHETHKDNEFIFEELDIDSVPAWFRNWQIKNNIPKIKFHDLRHTHATLLLYAGVDIKTISERLGHSNIGMTMNTYTHVLKELDVTASKAIDNL